MPFSAGLFAYLGPETFLPVASGIVGAAGVLVMFGRRSIQLVVQCCRSLLRKGPARPDA